MPVALRPSERVNTGSSFELIGGVFVPGIMQGEVWQSYSAEEIACRERLIVLV
jgi:hypothetical protein